MRTQAVPIPASANGSSDERDADQRDARPTRRADTSSGRRTAASAASYARSLTRSPRSPDGRKTSTAIRTRNANTSW